MCRVYWVGLLACFASMSHADRILIFQDDFSQGLTARAQDGTGIWSLTGRSGKLMSNSAFSAFLSGRERGPGGVPLGINPFSVEEGVLTIASGEFTPKQKATAVQVLTETGDADRYDPKQVKYYTGRMSTAETWSQTYGYFEITARIPEGTGQWPAFWLISDRPGNWPPEITIFEAFGRAEHGRRAWWNNRFKHGVHFNSYDSTGKKTLTAPISNPFYVGKNGMAAMPRDRSRGNTEVYTFSKRINARKVFGAEIYDDFWTWAVDWGPEEIVFYFGPDPETLTETYRTPTPDDLHVPMMVIVNNQIGTRLGWFGEEGFSDFEVQDDFQVSSISVYAYRPSHQVRVVPGRDLIAPDGGAEIVDSARDETIQTGSGLDVIHLTGGDDRIIIEADTGNKVIDGFEVGDVLVLKGFAFPSPKEALSRLTEFGGDLWLSAPRPGQGPQSIILRGTDLADIDPTSFETID